MKPLGISKTSVRRFLAMNSTVRNRNIPWIQTASFSHDVRRKRSEDLRALRKGNKPSGTEDSVDYRYRGIPDGLERQLDQSIEELWGDTAVEEEEKRQRNSRDQPRSNQPNAPPLKTIRKFVSFFDGVDEKMNDAKTYRKIGTNWKNGDKDEAGNTSVNRLFDALQGNSLSSASSSSGAKVEHRSIFDAFPLKSKTANPNAYDKQAFIQYHELMKEILESDKFCRKQTKRPIKEEILQPIIEWLLRDEQTLDFDYGVLKDAGKHGISMNTCTSASDDSLHSDGKTKEKEKKTFQEEVFIKDTQASSFYYQLMKQRESFSKKTGLLEEQLEIAGRALDILTSLCAKSAKSVPLAIAWEKSKEAGIIPSNDCLNVYLYVTGTSSSGLLSSALSGSLSVTGGRKKPSAVMTILGNDRDGEGANAIAEVKDDPIDFPTELAIFHDLLYKPTEKSVSLRVKRLVSNGDAAAAEKLLDSFPVSLFQDRRYLSFMHLTRIFMLMKKLLRHNSRVMMQDCAPIFQF